MKTGIRYFIGVTLAFSSANVLATGCDTCLQAKIQSASTQISSALSTLNSSASQTVTATQTVNTTLNAASTSFISILNTNQIQLLSSLDAASKKIEFTNEATTSTLANLTDTITGTISENAKNQSKMSQIFHNRDTYGPKSMPLSLAIAVNRSEHLTNALVELNGMLDDQLSKFKEWAYVVDKGDETTRLRREKALELIEQNEDLMSQLSTGLLTDDVATSLLDTMMVVVLPDPLDYESLSTEDQISYNSFIERKAAAYKVLAKFVLMKAPLLSTEGWDSGYSQIESEDDLTSIEEFIKSESDRKLLSEAWYNDVAKLNDVGLLREQVNQVNMQNYLLSSLVDAQKDNVLLKSLGVKE